MNSKSISLELSQRPIRARRVVSCSFSTLLVDYNGICMFKLVWYFLQWCRRGRCVPVGTKGYQDVDGNWGAWGDWSACYPTCGGGLSKRVRECNNPAWVIKSHCLNSNNVQCSIGGTLMRPASVGTKNLLTLRDLLDFKSTYLGAKNFLTRSGWLVRSVVNKLSFFNRLNATLTGCGHWQETLI